jgi:ATP-binding cassette, subfamily B, bacterial MsbA
MRMLHQAGEGEGEELTGVVNQAGSPKHAPSVPPYLRQNEFLAGNHPGVHGERRVLCFCSKGTENISASLRQGSAGIQTLGLFFMFDWQHATLRSALKPVRGWVPGVVVLGLAATALEGFGIAMLAPLISIATGAGDTVTLPGPLAALTEGMSSTAKVILIGGVIFALITAKNLVAWANGALQAWIYGRAAQSIRENLARSFLNSDPAFCLTASSSRLLNVVSNESWRAADAVAARLSLLVHLTAATILLLFLLAISPMLTLFVAIGLLSMHLVQEALTRQFGRLGREVTDLNRDLAARMLHLIGAWRLIRLSANEATEQTRFSDASDKVRRAGLRLQLRQTAVGPLIEIAYAALFLVVLWVAWRLGITFGEAAAFTILLYRMQPQVRGIQNSRTALRGWLGSLDEVGWLLKQPTRVGDSHEKMLAPPLKDGVTFDRVSFSYAPNRAPALSEASFELRWGEVVAIIGRSGSGKSTVVNLLCGLIRPDAGQILIGPTPLSAIAPSAWMPRIAVASPELELFDGTVIENILYGSPTRDLQAAMTAARQAGADDFVRALPQGYDTRVGNRGTELSAGQRQRIALARAVLRQPDILIMDEATNAMDLVSEAHALEILDRRRGNGISIVVSHHLSSIRACDRFLLFEDGRLISSGPAGDMGPHEMNRLLHAVS